MIVVYFVKHTQIFYIYKYQLDRLLHEVTIENNKIVEENGPNMIIINNNYYYSAAY